MYTNADNLMNKKAEFMTNVEMYRPDIIAVTEVLPKFKGDAVQDAELDLHDYDCFKTGPKGRGICVYVRNIPLYAIQVDELVDDVFQESMWCEIRLKNSDKSPTFWMHLQESQFVKGKQLSLE